MKYILLSVINYIYMCYLQLTSIMNIQNNLNLILRFYEIITGYSIIFMYLCGLYLDLFIYLCVNFIAISFYIYVVSFSSAFLEIVHSHKCN